MHTASLLHFAKQPQNVSRETWPALLSYFDRHWLSQPAHFVDEIAPTILAAILWPHLDTNRRAHVGMVSLLLDTHLASPHLTSTCACACWIGKQSIHCEQRARVSILEQVDRRLMYWPPYSKERAICSNLGKVASAANIRKLKL
jgi:hypothetical protein